MGSLVKARQNKATVPAIAMSNKALIALSKPKNKYNARKTECTAGHRHDSGREAARCEELRLMEQAGQIRALSVHPRYELIVYGQKICTYIADFTYRELTGSGDFTGYIIEDVKSAPTKTRVYKLKKKLVEALFNTEIKETM